MNLVKGVCQCCGGKIEFDSSRKMGVCSHCAIEFFVSDIVSNTTQNITVQNAVIQGGPSEANLIKRVKQFIEEHSYGKALEYANRVLDINADNEDARNSIDLAKKLIELGETGFGVGESLERRLELLESHFIVFGQKLTLFQLKYLINSLIEFQSASYSGRDSISKKIKKQLSINMGLLRSIAFANEVEKTSELLVSKGVKAIAVPVTKSSIGITGGEGAVSLDEKKHCYVEMTPKKRKTYWVLSIFFLLIGVTGFSTLGEAEDLGMAIVVSVIFSFLGGLFIFLVLRDRVVVQKSQSIQDKETA